MNIKNNTHRYIEWIDPDEMHRVTVLWLSEVKFMRDEQMFLNNLIKHYTVQLVDSKIFGKSKEIVSKLTDLEKEAISLMKKIQAHENKLEIMIDDIDQLELEKAYRDTHRELTGTMDRYKEEYMQIKTRLFDLVSNVLKKEKQKRLLN
ncbi:MAG: hypothetical protein JSV59_12875 [Flavobacteriaceae bacterium]|nr:MAG: hypothetical protein JSV59_12875 [Flavobacteriaceae bacterium]